MPPVKKFTRYRHKLPVIVDSVITYTLSSLCELVTARLMEAQETNGLLCYKYKHIFGFYYKIYRQSVCGKQAGRFSFRF